MKYQAPCIDCAKRQGIRIYQLVRNGNHHSLECLESLRRELDAIIDPADPALSPAELSLFAIRLAQNHAGSRDPFAEIKKANNRMALELYPSLKERITQSSEPLHIASKLAACGNIIDLGIHEDFDIQATIDKVMREGFQRDDYRKFAEALDEAEGKSERLLLYFCDNAGEIVFDKVFIEEIRKHYPLLEIAAVVRSVPVLNDATMEDAKTVGLDRMANVIENGNDELGTILTKASKELKALYEKADIIVSKGQANYETLPLADKRIFFILKAKCEVIAASLGVKLWDAVMMRGNG
ncbi:MAG: ARMT1-like domain-containing protein [Candidatus Omnitrophota bacterium]